MRIIFTKICNDSRDEMCAKTMRESDPNLTTLGIQKFMHLIYRMLQLLKDTLNLLAKELPNRGKLQIAPFLHE
ncbi:hypothetical protein D3C76_1765400 [compost metagenome]